MSHLAGRRLRVSLTQIVEHSVSRYFSNLEASFIVACVENWLYIVCFSYHSKYTGSGVWTFCRCRLKCGSSLFDGDGSASCVVFYIVSLKHDSFFVLVSCGTNLLMLRNVSILFVLSFMHDVCFDTNFWFVPSQILKLVSCLLEFLLLVFSSTSELVSECEPTGGDTSKDIFVLQRNPSVNSEVFDILLPFGIFAVETGRVSSRFLRWISLRILMHGVASCDVLYGIVEDDGRSCFQSCVLNNVFLVFAFSEDVCNFPHNISLSLSFVPFLYCCSYCVLRNGGPLPRPYRIWPGLCVRFEKSSVYPLVTFRWTFLLNFKPDGTYPIFWKRFCRHQQSSNRQWRSLAQFPKCLFLCRIM